MFLAETRTASSSSSEGAKGSSLLSRKLSHYRLLDPEDECHLDRVLGQRRRSTAPRSALIEQGEPPGEICVILEGWAVRQKTFDDGSRQMVALHLPGDVCEFNALLGAVADTETSAITAVRSASITGRMLGQLTAQAPRVGQALWRDAFSGGAIQREWLVNVVRRGAPQRVAHMLCELHVRLGLVGLAEENGFVSPLTQAHLANACGMTVEHTNRTLRKLRLELGITFDGGTVLLGDVALARRFAGFDERYILLRNSDPTTPWFGSDASRI